MFQSSFLKSTWLVCVDLGQTCVQHTKRNYQDILKKFACTLPSLWSQKIYILYIKLAAIFCILS